MSKKHSRKELARLLEDTLSALSDLRNAIKSGDEEAKEVMPDNVSLDDLTPLITGINVCKVMLERPESVSDNPEKVASTIIYALSACRSFDDLIETFKHPCPDFTPKDEQQQS